MSAKIITAISIILLLSSGTFGQKISNDYVDEFTKRHIITTDQVRIDFSMSEGAYMTYKKVDSSYFLYFTLYYSHRALLSVDEGSNFLLKLQNDSIVQLYVTEFANTRSKGKYYELPMVMYLTKADIENLTNYFVVKLRINSTDNYLEYEFNEKKAKKLNELIKVIP